MNKIVYINFGKLTPILYEAMCIHHFKNMGVQVVYLDVSSLLLSQESIKNEYDFINNVDNYEELERLIMKHNAIDTIFNIQVHYENRFYKLFRIIKKYNCRISQFAIGYGPNLMSRSKISSYFKDPLRLVNRAISLIITKIVFKLHLVKVNFDLVFTAGDIAKNIHINQAKRLVEINYIDYEKYVLYKNDNNKIKKNNIVFLDCNMVYHDDLNYANNTSRLNDKSYFKSVNNFFHILEMQLSKNILIAAHPKSDYNSTVFNNRNIIKDNTLELVVNSSCVLSHHSTSVSYAVLSKKPIIFFYTSEMEDLYRSGTIQFMKTLASVLSMPCINIEKENVEGIPEINEKLYDKYKYNYLTTRKSEQFTNKEIIERYLSENSKMDL